MTEPFEVRRLWAEDARAFRALRLLALRLHPEAFGSSFEEEAALSEATFAGRLAEGAVFGAWSGGALIGCVGLARRDKAKLGHKAVVWGMFVLGEHRGRGVGKRLLEAVLAEARTCFEEVLITVIEGNREAHRLYAAAGFEEYGREPNALRIGTGYHHELMMRLPTRVRDTALRSH